MIDRRIKIRHIQAFVEITRQGRMNRAAEALYLTQPAMSRTLKELEEIVGQPLLIRSRAGVTLTPQGKVFLHFARMSLAALRRGFDGVAQVERRGRSLLSVGLLPSVAAWLMPEVVREAELALPELALRILDGPHTYLIERLRSGDLDLVIGRMRPGGGGFKGDIDELKFYEEALTQSQVIALSVNASAELHAAGFFSDDLLIKELNALRRPELLRYFFQSCLLWYKGRSAHDTSLLRFKKKLTHIYRSRKTRE